MFEIRQRQSTVAREVLGGLTTFMAMSYILFVQPIVLGGAGMDHGAVFTATCVASAIACLMMGLLANYPIALAPGMGENFFFVHVAAVMGAWGLGVGWEMALSLTILTGLVFLALATVGFRSAVLNAIPDALKSGIAAGIGLLIAVIGFRYGNLVQPAPGGGLVQMPSLQSNPIAYLTLAGLAITLALMAFRVRGAILIGILASTIIALVWGKTAWRMPIAWPSSVGPTVTGAIRGFAGLSEALASPRVVDVLTLGFVLLFMDVFDTVGTLVGVADRAGLMHAAKLPKAERALAADAAATSIGALLGTSTVTSYIESLTGVAAGARTGLAALVTGACLLGSVLFYPMVGIVMGEFEMGGVLFFPTIAPALIVVGAIMLRTIRELDWDDPSEYLPGFLTMLTMPLAYNISAGIAIGFVSYAFAKIVTGRVRQCPLIVYVFAVLFVVRYVVAP
jgi:AGZA family xanthine/uracil permease-like MFS transporter